jgi:hypothetical protein
MNKWLIASIILGIVLACMIMSIIEKQIYYNFGGFKIQKASLNQLTEKENPVKLCDAKDGICIILEKIG